MAYLPQIASSAFEPVPIEHSQWLSSGDLYSPSPTVRGTICRFVRESTSYLVQSSDSGVSNNSKQDSTSRPVDLSQDIETQLTHLMDSLPNTFEVNSALQVLSSLESWDSSRKFFTSHWGCVHHLVTTTVKWLNELLPRNPAGDTPTTVESMTKALIPPVIRV